MGLYPIKQKKELTCEEEEMLAEQRLEEGLLSSDKGWKRYARENN